MGINKVQHPEWASPRCNNKNGLQQFSTKNSTSTWWRTSSRRTTSCTTLSTTKFDIKIWHRHRQQSKDMEQQVRSEDMDSTLASTSTSWSSRWTRRATTIVNIERPRAQQSRWHHHKHGREWVHNKVVQHLLKTFAVSSSSTSRSPRSTSCLVDVHSIVPSKGVTTTRCIATSTTAVQRQDATTSVANHCHQQHWHNTKKFTLIEEQFVDDIDDIDNKLTFSATSSSTRAVFNKETTTRKVINKLIRKSSFQQHRRHLVWHCQLHQAHQGGAVFSSTPSTTIAQQQVHQEKVVQQSSSRTNSTRSSSTTIVFQEFIDSTSSTSAERFIDNKFYKESSATTSFQKVWRNLHGQQSRVDLCEHWRRQTTHHQHCRLRIQRSTTTRFRITTSSTKTRLRRRPTTTTIRRRKRTASTT